MKNLLITCLLFILCSNTFPQTQKELLYKAYQDSSYEFLERFFENWRLEKTPITDEEYETLTDVQKDVYDLFYEFYDPFNLNKLNFLKGQYESYKDEKYVIIEPYIEYKFIESLELDYMKEHYLKKHFTDSQIVKLSDKYISSVYKSPFFWDEQEYYSIDSIVNFRPYLKFKNAMPLFHSPDYDTLISHFIGSPIAYEDTLGNLVWFSRSKIDFISPFISIQFMTRYWEIKTSPMAYLFIFDAKRENAAIYYSSTGHIGRAIYKKEHGLWIFVSNTMVMQW